MTVRIEKGSRSIALKWHKLRRRKDDIPFSHANLIAGLKLGASMEVDLQLTSDQTFVCLHDDLLDIETDGVGSVANKSAAEMGRLKMRGEHSSVTRESPLFLDDVASILSDPAIDIHEDSLLQLDLKVESSAVERRVCENFAALISPIQDRMILSSLEWPAVKTLGADIPGLGLGYDPFDIWRRSEPKSAVEFQKFADIVLAVDPSIAFYYLFAKTVLAATEAGFDLVGRLKANGAKIDVWTLDANPSDDPPDDGLLAQLDLAFELGVDQITTNTPVALAHLWNAHSHGR